MATEKRDRGIQEKLEGPNGHECSQHNGGVVCVVHDVVVVESKSEPW